MNVRTTISPRQTDLGPATFLVFLEKNLETLSSKKSGRSCANVLSEFAGFASVKVSKKQHTSQRMSSHGNVFCYKGAPDCGRSTNSSPSSKKTLFKPVFQKDF